MIVGLTGKKGSGKDTIGNHLVTEHGFVRVSFAQALKESVAALFDIPLEAIERWKNDPLAKVAVGVEIYGVHLGKSYTFREFLQRYGTEAHRDVFGDDFWVDRAMDKIEALARAGTDVVVTDVRFANEAHALRAAGARIVRVYRPSAESVMDGHASEAQLPQADFPIVNDGSFEYAFDQADRYIVRGEPTLGPDTRTFVGHVSGPPEVRHG